MDEHVSWIQIPRSKSILKVKVGIILKQTWERDRGNAKIRSKCQESFSYTILNKIRLELQNEL